MVNFRLCVKLSITYKWKRSLDNDYFKISIYSISPFFITIYLNFNKNCENLVFYCEKIRSGEDQYSIYGLCFYILCMFNLRLCLKLNIAYMCKSSLNNDYTIKCLYTPYHDFLSTYI